MISVVIPAYNCAKFIKEAVDSVLKHDCVTEILIIEDVSPDNTYDICHDIKLAYPELVTLFRHSDHQNLGAGASRNLGILNAKNKYIAFLDGDDIFLENRFDNDIKLLGIDGVDGVYNAIGAFYSDEDGQGRFNEGILTTVNEIIKPEDLFWKMSPMGPMGYFHCNGLTVKKNVLLRAGLFDESLRLSQDTHLWIKLSLISNLYSGNLNEATAMRRLHEDNRSKHIEKLNYYRPILLEKILIWALGEKIPYKKRNHICYKLCYYLYKYNISKLKYFLTCCRYKSYWKAILLGKKNYE